MIRETKRMLVPLVCCLLIACGTAVSAASVTYSASIPLQTTNWTTSMSVPKFDPGLGVLTSIQFMLSGHVQGAASFESLDAEPATITMNLQATITLQRPDLSTIVVTIPVVTTLDSVTAFDGTIDFGGTSGKAYSNLSGNQQNSFTSPPPAGDLVLFTASFPGEMITLPVVATGSSNGSGAGNLLLQFNTSASAAAEVTYFYDAVPEPSSILALVSGLLGLGGAVKLRKR